MPSLRRVAASPPSPRPLALGALIGALLLVAGAFAALMLTTAGLNQDANRGGAYAAVLATANKAERSAVDLETGLSGFLLTHRRRVPQPYSHAVRILPPELALLSAQVSGDPGQSARARRLARSIRSYERRYARPLLASGASLGSQQLVTVISHGKRLLDGIRGQLAHFQSAEQRRAEADSAATSSSSDRAILIASVGLALTILLILALAAYLARRSLAPVAPVTNATRRMAVAAQTARVPEYAAAPIAADERTVADTGLALANEYTAPTPTGPLTEFKETLEGATEVSQLKSEFVTNMSEEIVDFSKTDAEQSELDAAAVSTEFAGNDVETQTELAGIHVLVVDDDQADRRLLAQYLIDWGIDCETVSDPRVVRGAPSTTNIPTTSQWSTTTCPEWTALSWPRRSGPVRWSVRSRS